MNDDADELYRRGIKLVENHLGPEHPVLVGWLSNYASLLEQQVGNTFFSTIDALKRDYHVSGNDPS